MAVTPLANNCTAEVLCTAGRVMDNRQVTCEYLEDVDVLLIALHYAQIMTSKSD
jgi:hypothetical protein